MSPGQTTYDTVKILLAELAGAQSPDELARLLRAILDAHVIDATGVGVFTLDTGETVYDAEDLLGVGVWR